MGLGSRSNEGIAGKKVVSPRGRRQVAHVACARGLRTCHAVWLCSTSLSGLSYRSRKVRWDARLAQKPYAEWSTGIRSGGTG